MEVGSCEFHGLQKCVVLMYQQRGAGSETGKQCLFSVMSEKVSVDAVLPVSTCICCVLSIGTFSRCEHILKDRLASEQSRSAMFFLYFSSLFLANLKVQCATFTGIYLHKMECGVGGYCRWHLSHLAECHTIHLCIFRYIKSLKIQN